MVVRIFLKYIYSWTGAATNPVIAGNNYFITQTDLSKFKFEFDPERWIPSASDLNTALKGKKNLLDINKWQSYKIMFGSKIDDLIVGDFEGLIDIITENHFSKIINP